MRLPLILASLTAVVLAACAAPEFADTTETQSRTLTVREIDREARNFSASGGGQTFLFTVGPQVINYDQIEVGDELSVEYEESIAVGMASPLDTGETFTADGVVVAAEGEKPGFASGELVSTVVEFLSYDAATETALVRNAEGDVIAAKVPSDLQTFASTRTPGDRITVDIVRATAVNITPAG